MEESYLLTELLALPGNSPSINNYTFPVFIVCLYAAAG